MQGATGETGLSCLIPPLSHPQKTAPDGQRTLWNSLECSKRGCSWKGTSDDNQEPSCMNGSAFSARTASYVSSSHNFCFCTKAHSAEAEWLIYQVLV